MLLRRLSLLLLVPLAAVGVAQGARDAGSWSRPVTVGPATPGAGVRLPVVALDAHGTATAVWEVTSGGGYVGATARRPSGGHWSTPEALSGGVAAQLAVDPRGDALVVWTGVDGMSQRIRAVFRPAGGTWGSPRDVSPAGETASVPRVALDARGNALVVWPAFVGTSYSIRSTTRSAAGRWGHVLTLARNGSGDVDLTMNARGQALIAWTAAGAVNVSSRSPAGQWSAPRVLSVPPDDAFGAHVALNDAGTAVVTWTGAPRGTGPLVLEAAIRPARGGFGRARQIGGETSGGSRIAIGASGEAVAIWSNRDALYASARPPGGRFGKPQSLAVGGFGPAIGIDGHGNAIAVWTRSNGTTLFLHAARRPARGLFGQGVDLSPVGADCFQHRCLVGGEASIAVSHRGNAVATWTVNPDPRRSDGSYVQAASYTAR
ncbi:MAG TPA: hypothetical protein VF025_05260 [Gaiellaceae bacterium]